MPKLFWIVLCITVLLSLPQLLNAQYNSVSISGIVKDKNAGQPLAYVNVVLKKVKDSVFVAGTVTNDEGRFALANIKPDNYPAG